MNDEKTERDQEFKENDLLFAPKDFPRYMFYNKKLKSTPYGYILDDDEISLIKNLGSN